MSVAVKLGRLPAVDDPRVPFLSDLAGAKALQPPPASVNFYAAVGEWGTLGNLTVGDCVEACAGHATLQFTTYAGTLKVPTEAEAIRLYSDITGYVPGDEATDQGTLVIGPGSLMEYWVKTGIVFGGARSFARAFARLKLTVPDLQQAIHYFGGIALGINLPESIVAGDAIPYMWRNPAGPVAGGHCVWLDGYETIGETLCFDFISWGARYRMTDGFLLGVTEEAVTVYDPDSLNARGVDAQDFDAAELLAAMAAL